MTLSAAVADADLAYARVAADLAAPVKLAVTSSSYPLCPRQKSPAAAQELTAGLGRRPRRFRGALPAAGAEEPERRIDFAEVGRRPQILKVGAVLADQRVHGHDERPGEGRRRPGTGGGPSFHLDLSGAVELVTQDGAHRSEGPQFHPARLQLAGTRHAVTLALTANLRPDHLPYRSIKRGVTCSVSLRE